MSEACGLIKFFVPVPPLTFVGTSPFLAKTNIAKPKFVIFWIHIIVISTILTQLILIVFNPAGEIRPPLVLFIFLHTTTSLAFKHGLVECA